MHYNFTSKMKDDNEINEFLKSIVKPYATNPTDLSGKSIREIFNDKISLLNISQKQVENALGIEYRALEGILSRSAKRIDVVNLIKLSHFLDMSLESVVELCVSEMPSDVIGTIEKTKATSFIVSNFDIPHLRAGKFIMGRMSNEQIEHRLKHFFGFDKIEEYAAIVPSPAYMKSVKAHKSSNQQMRDFWVTSAYKHFEGIKNPNDYDRDLLVDLIPKLRPYTMNIEKGLVTVIKALYNIGITVIYQPHLPNVQAYGATFSVYNKPCIVITDLNKNYPTIWFALMHELHHVLYDMDEISKRIFHITGEPDLFLIQEELANEFAREYLFSKERSKYIEPLIQNKYVVEKVAAEAQVEPSFVYNFYNYDQYQSGDKYAWAKFKALIPNTSLAVKNINSNVWKKETIQESVQFFKEKVFNI